MEIEALKKSNVALKKKVVRLHSRSLSSRAKGSREFTSESDSGNSMRSRSRGSEIFSTLEQQQDLLKGMAALLCQQTGTTCDSEVFQNVSSMKRFLKNVTQEMKETNQRSISGVDTTSFGAINFDDVDLSEG